MPDSERVLRNTPANESVERDDITASIDRSWDDLFGMDRTDTERFQLASLRRRFSEQLPKLKSLRSVAEKAGITSIDTLEQVLPLLFPDSVYKSYPLSLIEKNRYDLMTKWLSDFTTVDISHVDVSECDSIDGWIDLLEMHTPLRVIHTSGTSGKLSFFPRSYMEIKTWFDGYTKTFDAYGSEPGVRIGHAEDPKMPVISPVPRHGRYIGQRNLQLMSAHVAPTPDQLYTLNGSISADLVSLAGRIRVAQAKGDLSSIKISDKMRIAMRKYLTDVEGRPSEAADFLEKVIVQLKGQRVHIGAVSNTLYQAAEAGLKRGLRNVFAPDSVGGAGGGGKGVVLPADWLDVVREFTGIQNWKMAYSMSEMSIVMPMGDDGWYHVPPFLIAYLLDPETGALLPREGVVTGRFAFHDLLAKTNWGGIVSGDKVTIDWEGKGPTGRKAPRIRADIERYSAAVTGEDKVTCAATVDNTDSALHALLAL